MDFQTQHILEQFWHQLITKQSQERFLKLSNIYPLTDYRIKVCEVKLKIEIDNKFIFLKREECAWV